jgi:hypothetical protein
MKYALGNMLNGAGGLNADQLALDLPFAVTKSLTAAKGPTPVLTRGSSATFVGSNGLIQSAGNNIARFDHDPVTLASRGLLIEEGRTNLSLYSGALVSTIGWGVSATTSIVDGLGPDGNNAYRITETTATAPHTFGNSGGITASGSTSVVLGTVYTGSIFIKKVSGNIDWIQVTLGSGGFGTVQYANFNIGNGTVGNSAGLASGTSPRIEDYGNGWYRCSISVAATTTTTASLGTIIGFIQNTNGTTRLPSYAGSTSNSVLASLCQFEAGSFATSYIPTTTSALARSADVCSITGANFTSFWNNNEGTVFASGDPRGTSASIATYLMANSGANANQVSIYRNTTTNFHGVANSGSYTANISASAANGSFNKIAGSYITNDARAAFNNVLGTPDTSVIVPTNLTRLNIGSSGTANSEFANGCISAIRYYKKSLSNAKLQALTA